jgi:hypothetical protein
VLQICNATHSEFPNCSIAAAITLHRHLSSIPSITSVDDGELVSFVLSTSSSPSNYRQLKGNDLSGVTSVKLSPSNTTVTIISTSSSSLFVQFPLGIGMNYTISFFVGSVEYSASMSLVSTFSYQRNVPFSILPPDFCSFFHAGPTIASISPSVVAGSITASMIGTGFGARDYTLIASFGATSCDFVTFTSDSRINVKVSHGTGKHSFQVNVYGQYATISAAYSIPILNDAVRANSPCSSAVLVQVSGIYFGISDSSVNAQLGSTHCESTSWQASSSIYCKWSRGFGTRLQVAATVSSQIGTVTSAVSYDRLFVSSPSSFNAPCFSPGSMLLYGKGFGFPILDVSVAIGGSASTGSVISSDSSVYSTISPGIGTGLSVSITIDSASGSKLNIFSYDGTTCKNSFCRTQRFYSFFSVAQVSSASPQMLPTSGQMILTLFGKNFGFLSSLRAAFVGVSNCAAVLFTSDTSISCTTTPGWGMMQLAFVNVNLVPGISSAAINFSGDVSNRDFMLHSYKPLHLILTILQLQIFLHLTPGSEFRVQ